MSVNITNALIEMDCTFYFILKREDKTLVFNEDAQRRICEKFASITDVGLYGMRSGPNVRSAKALQEEVSLLNSAQRDLFFERVMGATEDLDTATLAEDVLKELVCETEMLK